MIEREQVLHVAKLAQLRMNDAEVERMTSDLSEVLDHVERIGELDLDGVQSTAHVTDLVNVLRPDEPVPSWSPSVALEQAPDPSQNAFRVPPASGAE